MKKTLSILALAALVTGCTHQKVDVDQMGDKDLSCGQIEQQIADLDGMQGDLDGKTGLSGRNVGMALFFWPGIIVNEMNADDAEQRISRRKSKLVSSYETKGCS